MPLQVGQQLGPYEITALLGSGGMGYVYKARDTRLDRFVAIKVSKENFSERFEREARAVAALNHPHICTLHDIGPNYLVMEYLDGTPIKGPLPLVQVLKYGAQICDALDAAHRKNIIHRDLKPGNILLTKAGIKILDFGLAKMNAPVNMDEGTLTKGLTGKGEILGTLNYMSPEQLQGGEVGPSSDIFSLGLVLYEMLTGKRAFDGSSPASAIAAILERPTPSVIDVAPPELDRLLQRCLEKDPQNRWQNGRDLKTELEWIGNSPEPSKVKLRQPRQLRTIFAWAVSAALGVGLAITLMTSGRIPPEVSAVTFDVYPPDGETFTAGYPVISADGRLLAVTTFDSSGKRLLAIRRLDSPSWQKLIGTDGAAGPTWSPEGRYLAFTAGSELKKVDVTGGPVQRVTDVPGGWIPFLAWNREGVILFSRRDGLWKISASGTVPPQQVTAYDAALKEDLHGAPQFLPDGRHFLYLARSPQLGKGAVYVGALDAPPEKNRTFIRSATSSAVYVQGRQRDGYLLFENNGALMAQPFDPERLRLTGEPFLAVPKVELSGSAVAVSVSETGMMAWLGEPARTNAQLSWYDRIGKSLGDIGPPGTYSDFSLSPDGKRLAVSRADDRSIDRAFDLWLLDLLSGAFTPFTFDQPNDRSPIWSPDGSLIVYTRSLAHLYEKTATGTADRELPGVLGIPTDWSRDGHHILVGGSDGDLWVVTDGKAVRVTQTSPYIEGQGQFSPDGKWVAFVSDESKRHEIYVQAFPAGGEKFPISTDGGVQPRWRQDGKELFYVGLDGKLMGVPVTTGSTFERSSPVPLFDLPVYDVGGFIFDYVVSGRGPRFLVHTPAKVAKPFPIRVTTNWFAVAKK